MWVAAVFAFSSEAARVVTPERYGYLRLSAFHSVFCSTTWLASIGNSQREFGVQESWKRSRVQEMYQLSIRCACLWNSFSGWQLLKVVRSVALQKGPWNGSMCISGLTGLYPEPQPHVIRRKKKPEGQEFDPPASPERLQLRKTTATPCSDAAALPTPS